MINKYQNHTIPHGSLCEYEKLQMAVARMFTVFLDKHTTAGYKNVQKTIICDD
jgi:hypothetical protein